MIQQTSPQESLEEEQNQFLSQYMDYQSCPFCKRSFFRGKLVCHLKLCSREHPMSKNPSERQKYKKPSLSAATKYQRCENCKTRIPSFLSMKHKENCSKMKQQNKKSQLFFDNVQVCKENSQGESEDKFKQSLFPKLKNYFPKETDKNKTSKLRIKSTAESIQIREQLRCFRRAEEVQKVNCKYCGRNFSQKASLRHIPICSILYIKEQKQRISSKKNKSMLSEYIKNKISVTTELIKNNTSSHNNQEYKEQKIQNNDN